MKLDEIKLPFAENALAPVLSERAVHIHFNNHHLAYVRNLEALVRGTRFERHPLEEIIYESRGSCEHCTIFNNAAQIWNHSFFWFSLGRVDQATRPQGRLLEQVERDYGSFDALKRHMCATAAKRFGSGWLWLADFHGRLDTFTTPNAETPVATPEIRPVLTVDLWEHAYYVDWVSRRGDYVATVLDRLTYWRAASARFGP